MAGWIDLSGPVEANSLYVDGALAANNVSMTFPGINPVSSDYRAMGTLSLPSWYQFDNMQLTISTQGITKGLPMLATPGAKEIEARFMQSVIRNDSSTALVGCKAFFRVASGGIPELAIEPGTLSENDVVLNVLRYRMIIDGDEFWLIDRLNQKLVIMGKDYYSELASFL